MTDPSALLKQLGQPTPVKSARSFINSIDADEIEDWSEDLDGEFDLTNTPSKPVTLPSSVNKPSQGNTKVGPILITPENISSFMQTASPSAKNVSNAKISSLPIKFNSESQIPTKISPSDSKSNIKVKRSLSKAEIHEADEDRRKDKEAVQQTREQLKAFLEDSNNWFRKLDELKQPFTLGSVNEAIREASEKQEYVNELARETAWLEREVDRVERENLELRQQIESIRNSISEVKSVIEISQQPSNLPSNTTSCHWIMWAIMVFAVIFILRIVLELILNPKSKNTRFQFPA